MKIAFYQMRSFDEQAYIEQFSREFGIDYVTIPAHPARKIWTRPQAAMPSARIPAKFCPSTSRPGPGWA